VDAVIDLTLLCHITRNLLVTSKVSCLMTNDGNQLVSLARSAERNDPREWPEEVVLDMNRSPFCGPLPCPGSIWGPRVCGPSLGIRTLYTSCLSAWFASSADLSRVNASSTDLGRLQPSGLQTPRPTPAEWIASSANFSRLHCKLS
jgi:hypothetical protein